MGKKAPQTEKRKLQPNYKLKRPITPLPNYTLSTVCPACSAKTYRHACKVRCPRCGFMWDCSEL